VVLDPFMGVGSTVSRRRAGPAVHRYRARRALRRGCPAAPRGNGRRRSRRRRNGCSQRGRDPPSR
jgi:hypothetical protein